MKKSLLLAFFGLMTTVIFAQETNNNVLGHELDPFEVNEPVDQEKGLLGNAITIPPSFDVRTMAEWEEIQSLIITWEGFSHILKQIAFHAKEECEVIIIADNSNQVTNYLNSNNAGGAPFDDLDNITILDINSNSIWGRDYGAWTAYKNDVEDPIMVDWIYNRNRPSDDATPEGIAAYKGVPLYATTEAPWDLMATGGNFMVDGMGTAFSSELIIEENEGGNTFWGTQYPDHSLDEINDILEEFMGIDTYIKMDVLPFDAIHHIDMHMKLMDEETILMGEYPSGVADGPQIEANLEYVLDNYTSPFGTPYKVERIQMPPEGGSFPNSNGDYRTYSNMVFVNKTVLVPTYEAQYDGPALEIIEGLLPGYNVQGIECNDIIQLSGAIHCITKAVGVNDPMHIVHQPLADTEETTVDYEVNALINHASGISAGELYYRVDGGAFSMVAMSETNPSENTWTGYIPAQPSGAVIDYYVHGVATSGKELSRPMVAPDGFWTFEIGTIISVDELDGFNPLLAIYPNPANAITVFPIELPRAAQVTLTLNNIVGQEVETIFAGELPAGEKKFFIDASTYDQGVYMVQLKMGQQLFTRKLVIR